MNCVKNFTRSESFTWNKQKCTVLTAADNPTVAQLVDTLSAFYRTRRVITV